MDGIIGELIEVRLGSAIPVLTKSTLMKLLGCNRRNLSVRAERRLGGLALTLGFQSGPDLLSRPMWEPGCVFIKARGAPRFGVSCRTTDESCVCCAVA